MAEFTSGGSIRKLSFEDAQDILTYKTRTDLHAFMRRMHPLVMPDRDFIEALHLRVLAHHFELMLQGKLRRLLVALPPRWFKSYAASVAFPTYALGLDPTLRIMCASYGADLGRTFAEPSRDILLSQRFRSAFPATELISSKPAWDLLKTTANGYRRALSVGGGVTGKGADIGIVDDPMKAEEAASLLAREGVHAWFRGTFMSRFEKRSQASIVVVMQRLHMDDLIGRLLQDEGWTYLALPAQATKPMSFEVRGDKTWSIKSGDFLFPERHGPEDHALALKDMGESAFNAQIQQAPAPPGGSLIKLKWFNYYDALPHRSQIEKVIQVWDTALVDSDTANYSVGLTFAVSGKRLYLIDIFRRQMPYHELEKAVVAYRDKHKASLVAVEEAGTGIILKQNLRTLKGHDWLVGVPAKHSKMERIAAQTPKLERGRVYLPRELSGLDIFLHEVGEFPHGRYDDQVDALAHFLHLFDYGNSPYLRELSMYAGWKAGVPTL